MIVTLDRQKQIVQEQNEVCSPTHAHAYTSKGVSTAAVVVCKPINLVLMICRLKARMDNKQAMTKRLCPPSRICSLICERNKQIELFEKGKCDYSSLSAQLRTSFCAFCG